MVVPGKQTPVTVPPVAVMFAPIGVSSAAAPTKLTPLTSESAVVTMMASVTRRAWGRREFFIPLDVTGGVATLLATGRVSAASPRCFGEKLWRIFS